MEVKDNFLDDIDLRQLDELINDSHFAWYLQKEQVTGANDGYLFSHLFYYRDQPTSDLYDPVIKIFKNKIEYVSLCRMSVNLLLKQENPNKSNFHVDYKKNNKKITTAIFYLNTNNGSTEFENGDKIDCVKNRIVMFPTNTFHRAIGQTDVMERIVFNFNFISDSFDLFRSLKFISN